MILEGITLSEMSQRKENATLLHDLTESKKVESTEAESKRVVTSGRELGKMGDAGLGYKIAVKWDTF